MQAQSSTPVPGSVVPAICDTSTPLDAFPGIIAAYHEAAGGAVALDTIRQVAEAVRDSAAVVTLYCDGKAEVAARVLWPASVSVTKDKHLVCRAYCTLRTEWRTFRLDRMLALHALTTPDDVTSGDGEPSAPAAPDPTAVAVRLGRALVTLSHTATLDAADTAMLTAAIADARALYRAVAAA